MRNTQCLEAEVYLPINLILQFNTFLAYDEIFLHMRFPMKALNYQCSLRSSLCVTGS